MESEDIDLSAIPFEQIQAEYFQRLGADVSNARFFYTTDSPYRPTSGPSILYHGAEFEPLVSIEHAHRAALEAQTGRIGYEDYVAVGFGLHVFIPPRPDQEI